MSVTCVSLYCALLSCILPSSTFRAITRYPNHPFTVDISEMTQSQQHDSDAHSTSQRNTKFGGQVVIVTGAAAGIGREVALNFAAQDAQVILFDINEAGLQETQTSIQKSGGKAATKLCDISNEQQVSFAINWTVTTHGKVDILANLAGKYGFQLLADFPTDLYHRYIGINLNGPFFLTRAVLPHMQAAGYGRIIHTTSTGYADPKPGLTAYVATKAAVIGLVRSAAMEAGPGVTINAVMPGVTDTDQARSLEGFEALAKMSIEQQAVKRQGHASDIAHAVSFIASAEASFFSGQVFNCSGGATFSF